MKKLLLALALTSVSSTTLWAQKESTNNYVIDEVVVRASTKETNDLWKVPNATTLITPLRVSQRGVESIKDLTTMVPNLYIPDYGSKMTTPIYLRGIGTRSSGQSVGVYVNNIPYMDKSAFDFELMDIQRIEVLRGPQGTLYGRNAMGGIINIYTLSPLDYQGTKIALGAANYDSYSVKASNYSKLSNNLGISVAGYYDRSAGYFRNEYTGRKVDREESAGGRLKLDWQINKSLLMNFESSVDYTDQGAFAYGLYNKDTKEIAPVNYNDEGSYRRFVNNNNLRFEYKTDKVMWSSNSAYQYLDDDMLMDQDFTTKSIFTINQRQRQSSFTQEFAARSITNSNYQWSAGVFGFYNLMNTVGDVTFKQDGIKDVLQPVFDKMMPPSVPVKIKITDTEIPNPGTYDTPTYGLALFHQSTINNLFTEGLSLTLGVRLDYERQWLSYNTSMEMNTSITAPFIPRPVPYKIDTVLNGNLMQESWQFLPKASLKYECSENIMTYFTVSKGYKAGGYNIQMFSEVIQQSLKDSRPPMPGVPPAAKGDGTLSSSIAYKPEVTWNYELGMRGVFCNGALSTDLAFFYMDITDLQLTQFVNGGSGRILSNAGRGRSFGAEVSLTGAITQDLTVNANYGYTNAKFTDYMAGEDRGGNKLDYTGNFVPYTPSHTFSVGASYAINTGAKCLSQVILSANYDGCGKIYWNEQNDVEQPFYGLLNAKVTLRNSLAKLELWARNITATEYGAFYFESFGKSFVQRGKPTTMGVNLIFTL